MSTCTLGTRSLLAVVLASTLLVGCAGGVPSSSAQSASVSVQPQQIELLPGGSSSFVATVSGIAEETVNWSIEQGSSGGSIDASGNYVAPTSLGVYTVVARSAADPSIEARAVVTVTSTPAAPAPVITPGSGTFSSAVSATMACPASGTQAYYTTDGSTPSTSSTQGGSVTLSASGTLKAVCAGGGYRTSGVASATYAITGSTGGGSNGSWVTASGGACKNGPGLVPSAEACEWQPCKDDPMPKVVYYVCNLGGDDSRTAAQAQDPSTPWATSAKALTQFPNLKAGEAIAFCRGGTFTTPGGQWRNTNGTQAKPTIVRDYTRPGRAGMGDPRPIFNGEQFTAGIYPGRVKFENLAMHASTGSRSMLFDDDTTSDVTACSIEIANADIGFQWQYKTVPQDIVRHSVVGSRVLNSVSQGYLGSGIDNQIVDNYWYNNATKNTVFEHTIYLCGHSLNVETNASVGEYVARNEIHPVSGSNSVAIVVGGIHKGLTIENNRISFDIGTSATTAGWGIQAGGSGYADLIYVQDLAIRGNSVINPGNQGIGVATCKSNCLIENNLVINTVQASTGIHAPNEKGDTMPSNNVIVRNNTIYTPVAGSIGIQSGVEGSTHVVANNVVQSPTCYLWEGTANAYSERDYNACSQGADAVVGSHSWKGDPKWMAAGSDFRPAAVSPLVAAGDSAQKPAVDLDGIPRPAIPSLGALEP